MELSKTLKIIPKGTLVLVTEGEYSDYLVHGLYRAEQDIDIPVLLEEYLLTHPGEREGYAFSEDRFLAYLYVRDPPLLEEIAYAELFLGSCGNAEGVEILEHETGKQDA